MTNRYKGLVLAALAGLFVLSLGTAAMAKGLPGMKPANRATGGGLEAAAIGELGDTTTKPPFTKVLDLPALNVDRDAEGRIVMDLPGLKLVGPPKKAPGKLPVTGVNVGDFLAAGMAALSAGGVLARRLRLALSA